MVDAALETGPEAQHHAQHNMSLAGCSMDRCCHECQLGSNQKGGFDSFEQLALQVSACHLRPADHVQAVADSKHLSQPAPPPKCSRLQSTKSSLIDRQHTLQICLQGNWS